MFHFSHQVRQHFVFVGRLFLVLRQRPKFHSKKDFQSHHHLRLDVSHLFPLSHVLHWAPHVDFQNVPPRRRNVEIRRCRGIGQVCGGGCDWDWDWDWDWDCDWDCDWEYRSNCTKVLWALVVIRAFLCVCFDVLILCLMFH